MGEAGGTSHPDQAGDSPGRGLVGPYGLALARAVVRAASRMHETCLACAHTTELDSVCGGRVLSQCGAGVRARAAASARAHKLVSCTSWANSFGMVPVSRLLSTFLVISRAHVWRAEGGRAACRCWGTDGLAGGGRGGIRREQLLRLCSQFADCRQLPDFAREATGERVVACTPASQEGMTHGQQASKTKAVIR